jgi:hypothetical protein
MRLRDHITRARTIWEANNRVPPRAGYVVFSGPYLANSAGVHCLHSLCHELNKRGYPSFTTGGDIAAVHLNAPIVDEETATLLCLQGFVAVYPETVSGNPLGATNVIRWVLNRPGLLGGDAAYAASETVYSYSNVYTPYIQNRIAGTLYMPTIDESMFYCDDVDTSHRGLECYYVGKSTWKDGYCDPKQAFEITRHSPAKEELGKLFRRARVLFCFDNSTILIYEAALCGCAVMVIPDGTHAKSDFDQLELGTSGISWGANEPLKWPDVATLRNRLHEARQQFVSQLDELILASQTTAEQVDWNSSFTTNVDWTENPSLALAFGKRRLTRKSRNLERSIRLWRKNRTALLRHWVNTRFPSLADLAHYHRDRGNDSRRCVECYLPSSPKVTNDHFDKRDAIRITPVLKPSQLGTIFRASRRFYCFRRKSPLINYALACGCPVSVWDAGNHAQDLNPIPLTHVDEARPTRMRRNFKWVAQHTKHN